MKVCTPGIVWHSKEPVFTADFHNTHGGENWRLATGGADNDVKMWKVVCAEGSKVKVVFLSSLTRHTKTVNVVRFSPDGRLLASAGDDAVVCLWRLSEGAVGGNLEGADAGNKENWTVTKILRGHLEDIYDLCWSQRSEFIVTGSVDNTAIVWDVQKGQLLQVLKDSSHYVQGVAWDPLGHFITTVSSDRNMRVYSTEGKMKCLHTVSKISVPNKSGGVSQFKMWLDEGLSSFFRRLAFTPEGSLLIAPAGRFEGETVRNTTYIFARSNLTKPVIQLPGSEKATVAVRCCPLLFKLRQPPSSSSSSSTDCSQTTPPFVSLPYRVVMAVASLDSVLLYDTQHSVPFAFLSNLHYTGITDLAWSSDGSILLITSSDGYCSLVTFEPGELGEPLPLEQTPAVISQLKTDENAGRSSPHHSSPSSSPPSHPSHPSPPSQATPELKPNDIKPRRIRPTIISSFSSPTHAENKPPSSSSSSSSSPGLSQPQDNSCSGDDKTASVMETNNSTGDSSSVCANNGAMDTSGVLNQSGAATANTTTQKKARRVNLITLSTFPSTLTSAADTKSNDGSGKRPAGAASVTTGNSVGAPLLQADCRGGGEGGGREGRQAAEGEEAMETH